MLRHLSLTVLSLTLLLPLAPRAGDVERAAQAGDIEAMLRLAWRLEQYPSGRPAALEWYVRAADNGSIEAQYHLAQSYLNGGLGVVDAERAQYWYGRVREQGVCPSVIRAPHTL